ncbi:MAG: glycosyltransferase [Candidatus Binataceae bacterium]
MIIYTAGWGGFPRFTVELLKALKQSRSDAHIEFISHGECLSRYIELFRAHHLEIQTTDIKPLGYWRTAPRKLLGIRGTGRLMQALAGWNICKWGFEIAPALLNDCDAVLLPLIHYHYILEGSLRQVVGTFHDTIVLKSNGVLPESVTAREKGLSARAFGSNAHIVTSSKTTALETAGLFQVEPGRLRVIPLSGNHERCSLEAFNANGWQWWNAPFIFCPAGLSPHKNHRVLFEAIAGIPDRPRIVLTGYRMDLPRIIPWALRLRRLARRKALQIGKDIIGLGYVTDQQYYGILQNAWAMVMPTLAEGGGSFPVEEAILAGVPVVCSDIPVMREHMERIAAEVLWFDPHDASDLAAKLIELKSNYGFYKQRAVNQIANLKLRSWNDVAADYWQVIDEAAGA